MTSQHQYFAFIFLFLCSRRGPSPPRGRASSPPRRGASPPPPAPAARRRYFRRGPSGWDVKPAEGLAPDATISEAAKQRLRNGRRLYVGNLGEASEAEIERFFADLVFRIAVTPPKSAPILSVYINAERKFAFVEFCSIELANAFVALDGLVWNGTPLKIRRPVDYNPHDVSDRGMGRPRRGERDSRLVPFWSA